MNNISIVDQDSNINMLSNKTNNKNIKEVNDKIPNEG